MVAPRSSLSKVAAEILPWTASLRSTQYSCAYSVTSSLVSSLICTSNALVYSIRCASLNCLRHHIWLASWQRKGGSLVPIATLPISKWGSPYSGLVPYMVQKLFSRVRLNTEIVTVNWLLLASLRRDMGHCSKESATIRLVRVLIPVWKKSPHLCSLYEPRKSWYFFPAQVRVEALWWMVFISHLYGLPERIFGRFIGVSSRFQREKIRSLLNTSFTKSRSILATAWLDMRIALAIARFVLGKYRFSLSHEPLSIFFASHLLENLGVFF